MYELKKYSGCLDVDLCRSEGSRKPELTLRLCLPQAGFLRVNNIMNESDFVSNLSPFFSKQCIADQNKFKRENKFDKLNVICTI